jgi:hypothetical protein
MFNIIVGAGAGAASRYGSGSDQEMRLLAAPAPAPQHWLIRLLVNALVLPIVNGPKTMHVLTCVKKHTYKFLPMFDTTPFQRQRNYLQNPSMIKCNYSTLLEKIYKFR